MATVSVRELRNHCGEVLDRVIRGESLVVTRDGAGVAQIVPLRRTAKVTADLIAAPPTLPKLEAASVNPPHRIGLVVLTGYLLGTLPSADVAGRIRGVSVRTQGTGNPGALNATVLLGKRAGAGVMAVDVGKGWAAAAIGQRVSPTA
ncbi:MAG: glycerol-3-phosphate acyltransferase, partial [Actinomycetota bacterium]|nr:glycerol-3-phosphate acyltransferase [Actinomycetota bacterium]